MKSKKRKAFLISQIIKQRKWIDDCDGNGVSYADGERGINIRQADTDHLHKLEKELSNY